MKRVVILCLFCLIFVTSACGKKAEVVIETSPAVSTSTATLETNPPVGQPTAKPPEPTPIPESTESPNKPYDPSIFIIKASDTWREELAPEYYADYEIDLYLHKIDPNDNRKVSGTYEGIIWMKTSLDTAGYTKSIVGDAPIEISFDAGGEAIRDNLLISLNTTDDKGWVDYSILGENGQPLPLTQDNPVGRGSFVMVAKSVYLEAHGSGVQGEKVDYSTLEGTGDAFDVNYVIHVQTNDQELDGQRKVIINLSGEGFNRTIEGVMIRIPGYPEDVSDYYNSSEYQNSAWRRARE